MQKLESLAMLIADLNTNILALQEANLNGGKAIESMQEQHAEEIRARDEREADLRAQVVAADQLATELREAVAEKDAQLAKQIASAEETEDELRSKLASAIQFGGADE
jgi:N-methylhydantoinase B/oxoprolinase/acetone carboxylase alpha subunit